MSDTKTQIEVQLVKDEGTVSAPDDLIAGSLGAVYADLIKFVSAGEFKRGTLLMSGSDGYVVSTQEGLKNATGICILCDDITLKDSEFAEVLGYFEGEFNDARVIFPFESAENSHDEIVKSVAETLRSRKIFLRHIN